jgi:hypothetical protein
LMFVSASSSRIEAGFRIATVLAREVPRPGLNAAADGTRQQIGSPCFNQRAAGARLGGLAAGSRRTSGGARTPDPTAACRPRPAGSPSLARRGGCRVGRTLFRPRGSCSRGLTHEPERCRAFWATRRHSPRGGQGTGVDADVPLAKYGRPVTDDVRRRDERHAVRVLDPCSAHGGRVRVGVPWGTGPVR